MKMQDYSKARIRVAVAVAFAALICPNLPGQSPSAGKEARGLPPRASAADYQTAAKAGTVTIAADFAGHGVSTAEAVFSTEDYIVVEVGLFGAPAAHLNLSHQDFALRINGKKTPLPAQLYESVFHSLKDPEWVPPVPAEKSKSGGIGGGGGGAGDPPPAPAKMPMPLVLAMEQKVQKAAIPEGDRPLPEAGLLFFQYGGKLGGIHSIELIYNGAAGKATLALQ